MKPIILPALLLALSTAGPAEAATRAVACHGCSNSQMSSAAANALDQGTVYVFNASGAKVRKYSVVTEIIDTTPWTAWKQAFPTSVEAELKAAYEAFIEAREQLEGEDFIVLPPDFPVRSVGGAFLDPGNASTRIEDYLRELSLFAQMELELATTLAHLISGNVPFANLSSLIRAIRITVKFPDGSTLDYTVAFSVDAVTGEAQLEIEVFGNGRLENGQPAPTGTLGFNGATFYDRNGSLREWIMWARHLGLIVNGPANGTTMTCQIIEDVIVCKVVKKP